MTQPPATPAPPPRREALRGHGAMLGMSALVAGSFSLGGQMANDIDPVAFTALRFWFAALCLGAMAAASVGLRQNQAKAPWRYLLLGALFAVYFVTMFEGLKTAPPVSTAAFFTLTPIMAAGFGALLLGQRLTGRLGLALAVGGCGALWVIFRADPGALLAFDLGRGEAIYFVGCVAHALYTPLVTKLNRGVPPVVFSFGTSLAAALLLLAYGGPAIAATDWANLPAMVWITLGYTAVFATAVSFVALQYAALRLPAAKVMAYTYLIPAWVTLWEIALGQTPPPLLVLPGIAMTGLALALLLGRDP